MPWPAIAGLAISVLLLWWTLHDVSLRDVLLHVRRARWSWLLASVLAATLTFPFRTARWQYLLRLDGAHLPFTPLWHATAIGFMANNLLPARAGEFARAYAARHLTGVRFTAAFASLAVERVMDGVVLVALIGVAIAADGVAGTTAIGGTTLGSVAILGVAVFGAMLLATLLVVHWPDLTRRLVGGLAGRLLPDRLARGIIGILDGLLAGLDSLRSPQRFAMVTAWSVVVWVTGAASYWLAFQAFHIDVPWSGAVLLQSLVAFGVAIPSSPGFFGPFEAVTRATLALFAVPVVAAVSFAVAFHLAAFLPITLLGLWSLSRAHLHLADIRTRQDGPPGGGPEGSAAA